MATIARADSPVGLFESCPHNPILTHRHLVTHPIQSLGHADMIQDHKGEWWMVFLGVRPQSNRCHHLGRETFLAPLTWTDDGWPLVYNGDPIETIMEVKGGLPAHIWPAEPVRDDFNEHRLKFCWNFRRNPNSQNFSLVERPGWLKLRCAASTLNENESKALIVRRQRHFSFSASTMIDFTPESEGEEAGLVLIMTEENHYEIAIRGSEIDKSIIVRRRVDDLTAIVAEVPVRMMGSIILHVGAVPSTYKLGFEMEGQITWLAKAESRLLSSEVADTFTGVYLGMYAAGNGKESENSAWFDWFDYQPCEKLQ